MALLDDMNSQRDWSQADINALKGKYKRTHFDHFQGVDTSHIRTTRDNGYVWVRKDGKEIRVKREVAIAEGYKITSQKRRRRASVRREVQRE